MKICPRCQKGYRGHAAVSRADNATLICPDCGAKEALESLGVDAEEQNKILKIIHKYTKNFKKLT